MSQYILLDNELKHLRVPLSIRYCETFICQLRGFMFRRQIGEDEGLLLVQKNDSRIASSIHMLAVSIPLAVFWINSDMTIVYKILALPWRLAYISPEPAKYVLELNSKKLELFEVGDKIKFIE